MMVGFWDRRNLVAVKTIDLENGDDLKTALNGLKISEVNVIHENELFTHSDFDSFNPNNFEKYFSEDQLKTREDSDTSSYEKLKQQKVFTLSYLSRQNKLSAAKLHHRSKTHHLSTAMGNYMMDEKEGILVLVGENKMSLLVQKGGFKDYRQYDLESAYDYLYYILLAAENHRLDITTIPVIIGGNIDVSSPLFQTLKSHIYHLQFCEDGKYNTQGSDNPIHYYLPLLIARACA